MKWGGQEDQRRSPPAFQLPQAPYKLSQQSTNRITLKSGMALRAFYSVAAADFINPRQMPTEVLAETSCQIIGAFFFDHSIRGVVDKLVRGGVFIDHDGQANGLSYP
ncbi:hypothetical protein SAMN05216604_106113 [Pseudomonas agarici]|nr:hypothetical protein SAMN05216604_106113 [Pseudomonas agarici]